MKSFGGAPSLPILLDDIKCTGEELNVFQCSRTNLRSHNCEHVEDAGVLCKGKGVTLGKGKWVTISGD